MDMRVLTIEWAMERLPRIEQELVFLERKHQDPNFRSGEVTSRDLVAYERGRIQILRQEIVYLQSLLGIDLTPRSAPLKQHAYAA